MARMPSSALMNIVLLAAWLGAALVVAAVVAPAAFDVLPSRALAGALVGRVLPVLFWSGILVALLTAVLGWRLPASPSRVGAAIVLAAACVTAQLVIAPRIERVRAAIGGPMDALDPSNPLRQTFGRLHGASVACLGLATVAALVMLIQLVRLGSRSAP